MNLKNVTFKMFLFRVFFSLLVDETTIQEAGMIQTGLIDMIRHETYGDHVIQ